MIAYVIFTVVVLVALLYPVSQKPIDFDEKGEAIKVYRDEVAHIKQQHQKGLIDDAAQAQLLDELDKKSAMAMLAIEQKTFAYRGAIVPAVMMIVGLGGGGLFYAKFYREQGVQQWHESAKYNEEAVIEGLFDRRVIDNTLAHSEPSASNNYCFLLQHKMLQKYPANADALMNVAECHLQLGFVGLAEPAIDRALRANPQHLRANYMQGQLEFIRQQWLSAATAKKLSQLSEASPSAVDIGYLLALDYFSKGRFDESKQALEKLKPYAADNPWLGNAIADMTQRLARHLPAAKTTVHTAAIATNEQSAEATPAEASSIDEGAPGFTASVVLSPALREKISLPKTLFVIVKSPEGQLLTAAKLRFETAEKPLEITLVDGQAGLMQMLPMAGFSQVQVTARISQSGQTAAQGGDLTSAPVLVTVGQATPVAITIDQTVEK